MPNAGDDRANESAFEKLLTNLHQDRELAVEKYVELCFKLRKFFGWKRCYESDIDELVDETLDRIEKRLGDGETILNPSAYASGVAWNVWREYVRKLINHPLTNDPPDLAVSPTTEDDDDERYACLIKCLAKLADKDRQIMLGYYDVDENETNKNNRKNLATRFGKSSGALKVHATRLREKLRKCITECMRATML